MKILWGNPVKKNEDGRLVELTPQETITVGLDSRDILYPVYDTWTGHLVYKSGYKIRRNAAVHCSVNDYGECRPIDEIDGVSVAIDAPYDSWKDGSMENFFDEDYEGVPSNAKHLSEYMAECVSIPRIKPFGAVAVTDTMKNVTAKARRRKRKLGYPCKESLTARVKREEENKISSSSAGDYTADIHGLNSLMHDKFSKTIGSDYSFRGYPMDWFIGCLTLAGVDFGDCTLDFAYIARGLYYRHYNGSASLSNSRVVEFANSAVASLGLGGLLCSPFLEHGYLSDVFSVYDSRYLADNDSEFQESMHLFVPFDDKFMVALRENLARWVKKYGSNIEKYYKELPSGTNLSRLLWRVYPDDNYGVLWYRLNDIDIPIGAVLIAPVSEGIAEATEGIEGKKLIGQPLFRGTLHELFNGGGKFEKMDIEV